MTTLASSAPIPWVSTGVERLIYVGLALVVLFAIAGIIPTRKRKRRPPPRYAHDGIPSHTPAYDMLHASHYWHELRSYVYHQRARGCCERCGRPVALIDAELHLLHYEMLGWDRVLWWPSEADVLILDVSCHHEADNERRAETRSGRVPRSPARSRRPTWPPSTRPKARA